MRLLAICAVIGFCLIAGCTTSRQAESAAATPEPVYAYKYFNYDMLRGHAIAQPRAGVRYRLDMTLLDIDEDLVLEFLGLDENHELEPVTGAQPYGEALAMKAMVQDKGEVLKRPSAWAEDSPVEVRYDGQRFVIAESLYIHGTLTPLNIFGWMERAYATVSVAAADDGRHSISVESRSAHTPWPIMSFVSGTSPHVVVVSIVDQTVEEGTALAHVSPGESVVFFLSRAEFHGG